MTERTRIDPADIRVGDRVERRYIDGDHETIERFKVVWTAPRAVLAVIRETHDITPKGGEPNV